MSARRTRLAMAAAIAISALSSTACSPAWKSLPHSTRFQRTPEPELHRRPAHSSTSAWWAAVLQSTVFPLAKLVSPARLIDRMSGGRRSLDTNAFGQVADSVWFENRLGRVALAPEQIARGPGSAVPAPGPLRVVRGRIHHATPTLLLRDTAGQQWIARFDAPAFRELSTGAEMVASRMLHAIGYHVPNVQLLDVEVTRFVIGAGATRPGRYNQEVDMSADDLTSLLMNLNPSRSGTLRTVFYQLPGQPIGQFRYRGVRRDDPNDRIPHERRRSLRGLWVFSAWLNNTDTRPTNTLDAFIPVDGDRGFVRHYLIGFGDALGAAGERAKYLGEGYESQVEWPTLGLRWLALGLTYPYWLAVERSPHLAVGLFESRVFDPARWTPRIPNPAFDEATARDSYWAGSILARVTREQVEAAVATARYRNPAAAARIAEVLMERRDKVLRHVFEPVLAVDDPLVTNGYELSLVDLEVLAGLRTGDIYQLEARWTRTGRTDPVVARASSNRLRIDLREAVTRLLTEHPDAFVRDPFLTVVVTRDGHPASVEVHLRAAGARLIPVGLERSVY